MNRGPVVRHITPGLGNVPHRLENEACSGLVGAALGIGQAQADRGYNVQLLGWNPDRSLRSWSIGDVEINATSGWPWARSERFDFSVVAPLLNMSRRTGRADVLHVYADPHLLMASGANVRVLHLQTPTNDAVPRTWRHLLKRADAVVCCSAFIRNQFLSHTDFPEDRAHVVYNAVDMSLADGSSATTVRRALGIHSETPVILFAGAIVPEKGLAVLIQAAASLDAQQQPFEIIVAGGDAMWPTPGQPAPTRESAYTTHVRELAGDLRVHWLGPVARERMPDVYAACDVAVVPSIWEEPFGMVACEAMAAGKPVVASRAGGLPEIVIDGQSGMLVPRGDIAALGCALQELLTDAGQRERMGRQARDRAGVFSWTAAADALDQIYAEASTKHAAD